MPGFRLAGRTNGLPACSRLAPVPWLSVHVHFVPGLEAHRRGQQLDVEPGRVWLVPLVTVPATVTMAPGLAVCGLIESMAIDTLPGCAALAPVLVCVVPACTVLACTVLAGPCPPVPS